MKMKDAEMVNDHIKHDEVIKMLDEKTIEIPKKNIIKNDEKIIKKRNKKQTYNILCIILKEGKGSEWLWINDSFEKFSHNENTYFKADSGTYHKGNMRFFVYLEGVSLPFHHGYIEREDVKTRVKDKKTGQMKEVVVRKIKGLKFDSKIIDVLLNRNLADEFTKQHMDLPNLAIIILLIINVLVGVGGIVQVAL